MAVQLDPKQEARLRKLVAEQERAKASKRRNRDRWGLKPVRKGWLRGNAFNIRIWDEPGELGLLTIMEFELLTERNQPGVPVRMTGTDIWGRVAEGQLLDVRDPDPIVRPIVTDRVFFSYAQNHSIDIKAYYPGRDTMAPRKSLMFALLTLAAPAVFLVAAVAALRFVFHVI